LESWAFDKERAITLPLLLKRQLGYQLHCEIFHPIIQRHFGLTTLSNKPFTTPFTALCGEGYILPTSHETASYEVGHA